MRARCLTAAPARRNSQGNEALHTIKLGEAYSQSDCVAGGCLHDGIRLPRPTTSPEDGKPACTPPSCPPLTLPVGHSPNSPTLSPSPSSPCAATGRGTCTRTRWGCGAYTSQQLPGSCGWDVPRWRQYRHRPGLAYTCVQSNKQHARVGGLCNRWVTHVTGVL